MNEQEARTRLEQNDRALAAERERLAAIADADAREHTPSGQKPRGASDPKPVDAELKRLIDNIPPAFDRVVAANETKPKTPEEIERERKRKQLDKVLACVPPKPLVVLGSGRYDELADPDAYERGEVRKALVRDMPQATVIAAEWEHARQHRVLVLRGGVGTGKSTAAAVALYLAALKGARSASWHRPRQFISSMLHAYQADVQEVGKQFVVIDDMGEENRTDFQEALTTFLDESDARAVLTTNLTVPVFKERYAGRVIDRLRECAAWVPVKGESMRTGGGGFDFEGAQQRLPLQGQVRR